MTQQIAGFPGYHVTRDGRVWSDKVWRGEAGRWLQPTPAGKGYLSVNLFLDGRPKRRYLHHLVAEAYLGSRPDGQEVRHLNGDMLDNRVENLAYGTSGDNRLDTVRHGRHHNAIKTHCPRNHEYTPENTYTEPKSRKRHCCTCENRRPNA